MQKEDTRKKREEKRENKTTKHLLVHNYIEAQTVYLVTIKRCYIKRISAFFYTFVTRYSRLQKLHRKNEDH